MQTLRRFRKLIALVALIWLPMTVFAQVCATQVKVAAIGGMDQPGLVQPDDCVHHLGDSAAAASAVVNIEVDTETFWSSVDTFDSGCDMQSMCAFAGFAVVVSSSHNAITLSGGHGAFANASPAFATRSLTPDTPPPRLAL